MQPLGTARRLVARRGARKGLLPTFVEPSLATPCDKPPSGPKWLHEIKHDGYRLQARIDGRSVQLLTRKGLDWTKRFSAVADAMKTLGLASALIDGEVVVQDGAGLTSLNDLQMDLEAGRQDRFRYFAFDLLYCEGFDLRSATLTDRKMLLAQLLPAGETSPIIYSEHLEDDGPTVFAHSCRLGLEGIISKRRDLPYRSGRGDHWLKSKCRQSQEFIVLGYVASSGSRPASPARSSIAIGRATRWCVSRRSRGCARTSRSRRSRSRRRPSHRRRRPPRRSRSS